jgi:hypothetical protein
MRKWLVFTLNILYYEYMINNILYSYRFITECIELVENNNIMLDRGSFNIILFNSFRGSHNVILFNSTSSLNSILNLHSFNILYLFLCLWHEILTIIFISTFRQISSRSHAPFKIFLEFIVVKFSNEIRSCPSSTQRRISRLVPIFVNKLYIKISQWNIIFIFFFLAFNLCLCCVVKRSICGFVQLICMWHIYVLVKM